MSHAIYFAINVNKLGCLLLLYANTMAQIFTEKSFLYQQSMHSPCTHNAHNIVVIIMGRANAT